MNKTRRSVLVQLKGGCLPIEIELGRYQLVPRHARLYKQSPSEIVEKKFILCFIAADTFTIDKVYNMTLILLCTQNSTVRNKLNSLFSSRTLLIKSANFVIDLLKIRTFPCFFQILNFLSI